MKENLVQFETAKLLKKLKFSEPCFAYYVDFSNMYKEYSKKELKLKKLDKVELYYTSKSVCIHGSEKRNSFCGGDSQEYYIRDVEYKELLNSNIFNKSRAEYHWYSAPTLSLAQKWLREVHELDIIIFVFDDHTWNYEIRPFNNKIKIKSIIGNGLFKTYELALESGILEALKLIKV